MSRGGRLKLEPGFMPETLDALRTLGRSLRITRGGYQAILRDHAKGIYIGASESCKVGCALGY